MSEQTQSANHSYFMMRIEHLIETENERELEKILDDMEDKLHAGLITPSGYDHLIRTLEDAGFTVDN